MSKRSKILYLIVTLLFIFTSLAGGALAVVQMTANDLNPSNIGSHLGDLLGSSAYSIAGECDMACGSGSGSG